MNPIYVDRHGREYTTTTEKRPPKTGEFYVSTTHWEPLVQRARLDHGHEIALQIVVPVEDACCEGARRDSEGCCGGC